MNNLRQQQNIFVQHPLVPKKKICNFLYSSQSKKNMGFRSKKIGRCERSKEKNESSSAAVCYDRNSIKPKAVIRLTAKLHVCRRAIDLLHLCVIFLSRTCGSTKKDVFALMFSFLSGHVSISLSEMDSWLIRQSSPPIINFRRRLQLRQKKNASH